MTPTKRSVIRTDEEIVSAYSRSNNVWLAAAELGISGQTVSRRLKAIGHPTQYNPITDSDRAAIRKYYESVPAEAFDLNDLAKQIGRTRPLISRTAREMGLTNTSRPRSAKQIAKQKKAMVLKWETTPHPRGMAGKSHTNETKNIVSLASRKNWATWKTFKTGPMRAEVLAASSIRASANMSKRLAQNPERVHTRAKGGRRPDLGDIYFRSSWEANYARYLNLLKKMGLVVSWQFEPKTFWFPVKRGVVSYKPDFLVFFKGAERGEYHEIKGWVVARDRTKWARMAKYYPDVKLVVVGHSEYRTIKNKWASAIPEWEGAK